MLKLNAKPHDNWNCIYDLNLRNVELGSRTTYTATKLVMGIKKFIKGHFLDKPLKITTDKLAAYQCLSKTRQRLQLCLSANRQTAAA